MVGPDALSVDPGWSDYAAWQAAAPDVLLADVEPAAGQTVAGRCDVCGAACGFLPPMQPADTREGMHCAACGCMARQRAVARVLASAGLDPGARAYLTEQASPLYVALRARFPALIGSEYVHAPLRRLRLMLWLWRRGVYQQVHRGDVTRLVFADATLDAALSLDVLEHVPDAEAAFREFARVLRPGGHLIATVPFYQDAAHSKRIASLGQDGEVVHHGPAEFHGDPLGGGVLCFHHFGWDLPALLIRAGFAHARMHYVRDAACGLPRGIWVLAARR